MKEFRMPSMQMIDLNSRDIVATSSKGCDRYCKSICGKGNCQFVCSNDCNWVCDDDGDWGQ